MPVCRPPATSKAHAHPLPASDHRHLRVPDRRPEAHDRSPPGLRKRTRPVRHPDAVAPREEPLLLDRARWLGCAHRLATGASALHRAPPQPGVAAPDAWVEVARSAHGRDPEGWYLAQRA